MPLAAAPPPVPAAALVTLAAGAEAGRLGTRAELLWPGQRTYVVRLPGGATPAALRRLRRLPGVAFVEPDLVRWRRAGEGAVAAPDPLRRLQAHLVQIRWVPPSPQKPWFPVAVLDTGADPRVPDLQDVLDMEGARSFAPGAADPFTDAEGHGTHVVGILAAGIDNGIGVTGVARATVLPVKIADQSGRATTSSLVRGINYAVARGARVVNVSFGGGGRSRLEQEAIDRATRAGALVVAAAGNSGARGNPREYPGAYRHVLAVGAVDGSDEPLPTSTRGAQVAIAAPGLEILSTSPPGASGSPGYATRTGTSMAAAMVSGAAVRVWSARPALTASQVAAILTLSARDVGAPGQDAGTGAGVVDLAAALARAAPPPDGPEPNDDPATASRTRPLLAGAGRMTAATSGRLSVWSDPRDLHRVTLAPGDRLTVDLAEPAGADLDLVLWRPGTRRWYPDPGAARRWVAGSATGIVASPSIDVVASQAGVYFIEVRSIRGGGRYRLSAARVPSA